MAGLEEMRTKALDLSGAHAKSFLPYSTCGVVPPQYGVEFYLSFGDKDNLPVYTLDPVFRPLNDDEMRYKKQAEDDEINYLIDILPQDLQSVWEKVQEYENYSLVEIILDVYRIPTARFGIDHEVDLTDYPLDDLTEALHNITSNNQTFSSDNRIGISQTLHRISAIRDKYGEIVGLTYRIGRHIPCADLIQDLLYNLKGSLLLMGPPGVGKTSLLRDVTAFFADTMRKRVIIVDTTNEIAGDGVVPHKCIGRARRMQVRDRREQSKILIEAVQNHNPQIVVIDEIGTPEEVNAARTISQRGVQMIATAHGENLHSLLKNPPLRNLIGGIKSVTLGDVEAHKRANENHTEVKKTILEREGAPTFNTVIEMLPTGEWTIYLDIAKVIDEILCNGNPLVEIRLKKLNGLMFSKFERMKMSADALNVL
jgi:stage III sporulation protein AA